MLNKRWVANTEGAEERSSVIGPDRYRLIGDVGMGTFGKVVEAVVMRRQQH